LPTSSPASSPTPSPQAIPNSTISCQQPRLSGAPSGDALQSSLTAGNSLQTICQTSFTPQDQLHITYNDGFIDISVARKNASQALQWCVPGLNAIISSCIVQQNFFGGVYAQGDEEYNISNVGYPSNQNPISIPLPSTISQVGYPEISISYF
jgi:hypothetical protein